MARNESSLHSLRFELVWQRRHFQFCDEWRVNFLVSGTRRLEKVSRTAKR
jgi:hypothetical protein